jgi:hypothetical protein
VEKSYDRKVTKVVLGKTHGRRKAGRPKFRWLDCIENDLKLMVAKYGGRKQKTDPYGLSF